MKSTLKNKKGITLIALIASVIIMLILAGVSISGLTSDGGLFEKTSYAKELFNFSQIREGIELYDIFNIDNGRELPVGNNVTLNELNNIPSPKEIKSLLFKDRSKNPFFNSKLPFISTLSEEVMIN